jgi:hypothetical protein
MYGNFSITWGLEDEKPGFSEKPGFFPRTIEMIRLVVVLMGCIKMASVGQVFAHSPQPQHLSGSNWMFFSDAFEQV